MFRADRSLERTRTLLERGTVADAALEEAEELVLTADATAEAARSGVTGARAQQQQTSATLDVARLDLATTVVAAPVGGIVPGRSGQLGAITSATGDPIYRIIRDGEIEVEADVIETDLGEDRAPDEVPKEAGDPAVR